MIERWREDKKKTDVFCPGQRWIGCPEGEVVAYQWPERCRGPGWLGPTLA